MTGAKSYEDLLTVDGIVHPTYKAACLAQGLLEDDGEQHQCLTEAAQIQTGKQLCDLFVIILLSQHPTDALALWTSFRDDLCDDFHLRLTVIGVPEPTQAQIYDYGLFLLDLSMKKAGKSLSQIPEMLLSTMNWAATVDNNMLVQEMAYDTDALSLQVKTNKLQFNAEQNAAFTQVMHSVTHNEGKSFFLHSAGGCGKTFVA